MFRNGDWYCHSYFTRCQVIHVHVVSSLGIHARICTVPISGRERGQECVRSQVRWLGFISSLPRSEVIHQMDAGVGSETKWTKKVDQKPRNHWTHQFALTLPAHSTYCCFHLALVLSQEER